jgi:uncharacterized iron-regulated membrane protein
MTSLYKAATNVMYKVHKWLGISAGLFIVLWFISGLVMILPKASTQSGGTKSDGVNFEEYTLSPAEALRRLSEAQKEPAKIVSLNLIRLRGSLAYKINAHSNRIYLVDARSGQIVTITRETAEQLARDDLATGAPIVEVSLVTTPGLPYGWGPLPVYRVVFDDSQKTISFVSLNDGRVRRTNRWGRLRDWIIHLHTLQTLNVGQEGLRKSLLWVLSLLGLAAIAAGYYLVLPARRYTKASPRR